VNDVAQFKFEKTGRPYSPLWEPQDEALKARLSPESSPRLVGGTTFDPDAHPGALQIAALAKASLKSLEHARNLVTSWHRQGQSLAEIYLNGFAPAARLLGTQWSADQVDFVHITIAVSHLQALMHEFSASFLAEGAAEPNGLCVLVMTEPGAQHTLGSFMLSEFLRREGWCVTLATPADIEDFKQTFQADWFDAVMLSISTDRQLAAISAALPDLLSACANPNLHTYVGGAMANLTPDVLTWPGTRLLTGDALSAVSVVTRDAAATIGPISA